MMTWRELIPPRLPPTHIHPPSSSSRLTHRYYMLNIFQNPATHTQAEALAKSFDARRIRAALTAAT